MERHLIIEDLAVPPGGEWKPTTPGWTVIRIADGAGYCLQGAGAQELNAGDAVVVGPAAQAMLRASQLGIMKIQFFLVLPQYLNGLLTITDWGHLNKLSQPGPPRALHFPASDPIAQKFFRLAALQQRDGLAARSTMLQLWATSINVLLPAHYDSDRRQLRDRFREMIGKISEAELAARSLAELAAELNCSERHFSRIFREEFKVSLRSHQTMLRLHRASQLLAESGTKVAVVAKESGYRHVGLFNQMFKKQFGMTPSAWRERTGAVALALFLPPFDQLAEAMELTTLFS